MPARHAPPGRLRRDASDAGLGRGVEREAHRTFLNWVGCAIGASRHAAVEAALAAVQELSPSAQATLLGRSRARRRRERGTAERHRSHTFDFDDTHLRTIIHPAGPVVSAALAVAEHAGACGRQLVDAVVLGIDVACRVGNAVYPDHYDRGLAHHRLDRHARRRRRLRAAARPRRAADRDGARHRRVAADRRARAIRVDDQAVSRRRRGPRGADVRVAGAARLHRFGPRARSTARAAADLLDAGSTGARSRQRSASASRSRSTRTSRSPAGSSFIPASTVACSSPRAHRLSARDIERIELKVHPLVLELTGKTRTAHRPRGQVQRLPCQRRRNPVRQGRRGGIRRRHRCASRRDRAARSRPRERRRRHRRSVGRRHDRVHRRASIAHVRPPRNRQPRAADDATRTSRGSSTAWSTRCSAPRAPRA